MAKITVETKGEILEKERQEAFQIADKTFTLLKEVGYENIVEIIKVTCWREYEIAGVQAGHYGLDFQLVFSLPSISKKDQPKMVVRWNKVRDRDKILAYKDQIVPSKYLPPGEPQGIKLRDEEIKTLAAALIEAMRMAIQDRQDYLGGKVERLAITNKGLEPLTKVPARA